MARRSRYRGNRGGRADAAVDGRGARRGLSAAMGGAGREGAEPDFGLGQPEADFKGAQPPTGIRTPERHAPRRRFEKSRLEQVRNPARSASGASRRRRGSPIGVVISGDGGRDDRRSGEDCNSGDDWSWRCPRQRRQPLRPPRQPGRQRARRRPLPRPRRRPFQPHRPRRAPTMRKQEDRLIRIDSPRIMANSYPEWGVVENKRRQRPSTS